MGQSDYLPPEPRLTVAVPFGEDDWNRSFLPSEPNVRGEEADDPLIDAVCVSSAKPNSSTKPVADDNVGGGGDDDSVRVNLAVDDSSEAIIAGD